MKRRIALTLALSLLLSVAGCSVQPAPTTAGGTPAVTTTVQPSTEPDPDKLPIYIDSSSSVSFEAYPVVPQEYEVVVTRLPETVENPRNLPVLKWVCLVTQSMWKPTEAWSELAMVEVNEMLADRNMPFRLQLVIVDMKGRVQSTIDWTEIPEAAELIAQADLLNIYLPEQKAAQYLLTITDHVTGDALPSLKNSVLHQQHWTHASYNGQIYGTPVTHSSVNSNGWQVNTEMLENWGLTAQDFQKNYWEMDAVFAKIYEKNGGKPFLNFAIQWGDNLAYPNCIPNNTPLRDYISSLYQCNVGGGFAIDFRKEKPEIVDVVQAEDFRLTQAAVIRYHDAGYAGSDGMDNQMPLRYGQTNAGEPYTSGDSTYIPVTDSYLDLRYSGYLYLNGVSVNTAYREQALQLLNLIAEDEDFRLQLCCGKEGRDYELSNGKIPNPLKQEGDTSYCGWSLSALRYISSRFGYAPAEDLGAYLGADYISCPIVFDFTGLEQELKEREVLLGNFYRRLAKTKTEIMDLYDGYVIPRMDAKGYDRMLQLVQDAGSDKIRDALQAHLDAWLEAHPDWTAKVS